jgi:outer membrane protein assembly factor BamD (BamD/ComL family)
MDTLSAEVRSLDDARHALAVRQPHKALETLELFSATHSARMLSEEAAALRIAALVAAGRTADARSEAVRFVAEHPTSPLVARVRASLPREESRR